jgi:D-beta-D-heptose 7-phosphate kinase/D-beta-D-heptose 1-phosphate adenosyltransferase
MINIWTNGCFDLVHIGHVELFKYAKSLGQNLIVGIDSDIRVKSLKGISRPINNENNRKNFLHSIRYIDDVVIFDSDESLMDNILKYQIDTIVVGDDYKDRVVIGSHLVQSVFFFPKIPNYSSSIIYEQNINNRRFY